MEIQYGRPPRTPLVVNFFSPPYIISASSPNETMIQYYQIKSTRKYANIDPNYYLKVLSHVRTNNKSPPKYFELDSATCNAAKELSVDTNRVSLRQ